MDGGRSCRARSLKALGTIVVVAATALATRHLGSVRKWTEAIPGLSDARLVLILAVSPLLAVLVAFIDSFVRELIKLARGSGQSSAQLLWRAPEAFRNVSARQWNRIAAALSHHTFDGRYRQRIYEDYGTR
jgi:hypothetical protein